MSVGEVKVWSHADLFKEGKGKNGLKIPSDSFMELVRQALCEPLKNDLCSSDSKPVDILSNLKSTVCADGPSGAIRKPIAKEARKVVKKIARINEPETEAKEAAADMDLKTEKSSSPKKSQFVWLLDKNDLCLVTEFSKQLSPRLNLAWKNLLRQKGSQWLVRQNLATARKNHKVPEGYSGILLENEERIMLKQLDIGKVQLFK